MKLTGLTLYHFRNYEELHLALHPGVNLLVGGGLLKDPGKIGKALFSGLICVLRIALACLRFPRERARKVSARLGLHEFHSNRSFCKILNTARICKIGRFIPPVGLTCFV